MSLDTTVFILVPHGTRSRWNQHIVEKYQSRFKINLTIVGGIPWYPDMKVSSFRIRILLVPGLFRSIPVLKSTYAIWYVCIFGI